jgi:hypothetical protein
MVLPRRFEPLNGQSMAVDETDAQIDAYKAGLAAKVRREERIWRGLHLLAIGALAWGAFSIASAIYQLAAVQAIARR